MDVEQNVRRLDVAVERPLPVRVLQGLGHLEPDPRDAAGIPLVRVRRPRQDRVGRGHLLGRVCRRPVLQPSDLLEHLVEAEPADELHGVVVEALALAHAEDRHDVGVMKLCRGPGLAEESLDDLGGPSCARRKHFYRDMPVERFLLGLVDDPHAPAAQLAQDAEVAKPFQDRPVAWQACLSGGGCRVVVQLDVLDEEERREKLLELPDTFGSPREKLAHGWPFAAAHPVEELLGQRLERVAAVLEVGFGPAFRVARIGLDSPACQRSTRSPCSRRVHEARCVGDGGLQP